MEDEVKIEVRFKYGIGRSITTKKFGVLALKMNKDGFLKFLTWVKWISYGLLKFLFSKVEVKMEAEVKIEVRLK